MAISTGSIFFIVPLMPSCSSSNWRVELIIGNRNDDKYSFGILLCRIMWSCASLCCRANINRNNDQYSFGFLFRCIVWSSISLYCRPKRSRNTYLLCRMCRRSVRNICIVPHVVIHQCQTGRKNGNWKLTCGTIRIFRNCTALPVIPVPIE